MIWNRLIEKSLLGLGSAKGVGRRVQGADTIDFLIAATLYFAAALPELAPHAKFEIWHFYIWHMRSYLDIRAHMRFSSMSKRAGFQMVLSITQAFLS